MWHLLKCAKGERVMQISDKKTLKKLSKTVDSILDLESSYKTLSDEELQHKTIEFKERIQNGESLDSILPEAYAVVREADYRVRMEKPFPVQVLSACVLHNGDIAEQKTGEGKAVTLDTPIPTPTGWKKAGDIKEGDIVLDNHGKPTTIVGVYPQGKKEVYRFILKDGREIKCAADHLWTLYSQAKLVTMTTQEILDTGVRMKNGGYFHVPMPDEAVEYEEKEFELSPYKAGVQCGTEDKPVPNAKDYCMGSIAQRWSFIQGIMDQKGHIESNHFTMSYYTSSEELRDIVSEIIFSFGYSCEWKENTSTKRFKNCKYQLTILVPNELKIKFFKWSKGYHQAEAAGRWPKKKKFHQVPLVDIIPTGEMEEQVCFTVDNEEHLFLVGNYVVTHNTLTSTMPVYLNALTGKGVHVVTVNEYLSERDSINMGMVFNFLGLSVGLNKSGMSAKEKREAYACDITYTTNSELGFDYLRDNMVYKAKDKVMRGLHYALIDEADSILIDESRTPLIISASEDEAAKQFQEPDAVVKRLDKDDVSIDIKTKQVYLLPSGISKVEKAFGIDNLYDTKYSLLVHRINQALKANFIMVKDVDYLVKDDAIHIIDQFTGRLMSSRQYSDGLHQAIEAKEGVTIHPESKTVATITYQNFFRLYDKLAGMTGTAKTEEEEFLSIYNMRVIPIPTNKPVIRKDLNDRIYSSQEKKYQAILNEILRIHETGQPILVGTVSVENNEKIHQMLSQVGIPHEVLNAKNHAREAEIIAKAGQFGAVTVATNMAGRGTDIKLSSQARNAGGLAVIGTEHHESRRIDNQLRGRSGRQGDPGVSRFFVALDDDLMKRFSSDKIKKSIDSLPENTEIESKMFSKAIVSAQKRVEGSNFDIRKQLINYDDVLRKQREIIYADRDKILNESDMRQKTRQIFEHVLESELTDCMHGKKMDKEKCLAVLEKYNLPSSLYEQTQPFGATKQKETIFKEAWKQYQKKTLDIEPQIFDIEKNLYLHILDEKWQAHIDAMSKLRESIYLRSYAQNDPLQQYVKEAFITFQKMLFEVEKQFITALSHIRIQPTVPIQITRAKVPVKHVQRA